MTLFGVSLGIGLLMVMVVAITPEQKTLLLMLHNAARQKVLNCTIPGQPPTKAMPELKWHTGLSKKAQEWSDQCKAGPQPSKDRKVEGFQRIAQNVDGRKTVQDGFYTWFDEHSRYSFEQNKCSGVCDHYRQLVWAKTEFVGCGVTDCPKDKFPFGLSIVCNYAEGGNTGGERPYVRGEQSDCQK